MAFLNLNKLEKLYIIRWLTEIDIILNILIETKFLKEHEKISKVVFREGSKHLSNFCRMTPIDFMNIFPTCDLLDDNFSSNLLSKNILFFNSFNLNRFLRHFAQFMDFIIML
jgi:hypothetical protein